MNKILQAYLRFWTKRYLKRTKPKIIAITGSIGKTSTKDAIFEVLKIKFVDAIRKSQGNLNNETGVPLAILGYKKSPQKFWQWLPIIFSFPFRSASEKKFEILVLEFAADKPGDIKYLTNFVKPDIAIINSIGPAHLKAFGDLDKTAEEKSNLIKVLPHDGWAVLNVDDERVRKMAFGGRWNVKTYSIDENSDLQAHEISTGIQNMKALTKFKIKNQNIIFQLHTLGDKWNIYSALAAILIGQILDLKTSDIQKGLQNIKSEKHRMNVLKGKNNSIIIDDCYNANPLSMKAALELLKNLPLPGRKIAVLGDMLELGKISNQAHQLIGEYANEVCDEVIAVGKLAKKYLPNNSKNYFNNREKAAEFLLKKIQPGDTILIKASRAIGLENIVEALKV